MSKKSASQFRRIAFVLALAILSLPQHALGHTPGRPPVEVRISTTVPDTVTNTVVLTMVASWVNVGGVALCTFYAVDAELTDTSLIFKPLEPENCVENYPDVLDTVVEHYTRDASLRQAVATILTAAGENLWRAEEIRRGCPHHPLFCSRFRPSVESAMTADAPRAVVVRASVAGPDRSYGVTCTFLAAKATLTPTELIFEEPPTHQICVGDSADAVDAVVEFYAQRVGSFQSKVDFRLKHLGKTFYRAEEIGRGCPNHPGWCFEVKLGPGISWTGWRCPNPRRPGGDVFFEQDLPPPYPGCVRVVIEDLEPATEL